MIGHSMTQNLSLCLFSCGGQLLDGNREAAKGSDRYGHLTCWNFYEWCLLEF